MTVVAFVAEPADANPVVTWAGKFAAAQKSELVIFYVPIAPDDEDLVTDVAEDDQLPDAIRMAVASAIEGIVRTRRARKGRIPRHQVSIQRVSDPDPVAGAIARFRIESPDLLVAAAFDPASTSHGQGIAQRVVSRASCDAILLLGKGPAAAKTKQIMVATSDSGHDLPAVQLAASTASAVAAKATVISVEASVGEKVVEVGERHLRSLLRELGLEESSSLAVKAVVGEVWSQAVAEEVAGCDLILLAADKEKKCTDLLEAAPKALVGLFHRAPRLGLRRYRTHRGTLLPQINPTDYADLYDKLQAGSRWNSDFVVMLGLAAGIATLGLLQSSTAVVIGSMLLAPLMTPMIGMGLALNQGNSKLAFASLRAISRGFLAALAISAALGLITPGSDLTPEILARTEPNILDLLIALFSGAAAAYALARPSLAGTIAGVAIATALIPPLCSSGISLAYRQYPESAGALFLLLANVVAIMLGAAGTFRMMGLQSMTSTTHRRVWVRYTVAGLCMCALMIAIPLVNSFLQQAHEGKDTPYALALTNETRDALIEHVDGKPGVHVLFAGRSGIERESDPIDIGIILSSREPLPRSEADELVELIRTSMQNPALRVRIACVAEGWANETLDGAFGEALWQPAD